MAKKRAAKKAAKRGPGRPASGLPVISTDRRITPRFMLRLPNDLREWLDAEAERNGRTTTDEILAAISEKKERSAKP
jgi:hypothetical protein